MTPHSFSFIFSCAVAVVAVCLQLSPNLFAIKGMFGLVKLGTREVIWENGTSGSFEGMGSPLTLSNFIFDTFLGVFLH